MIDLQEEGLSVLSATRGIESIVYCGEVTEVNLLAGQHIVAGTIVVGNDGENLYVTYTTTIRSVCYHPVVYHSAFQLTRRRILCCG